MCGFVGVFNKHPLTQTADQEELIKQMNQMIVHRGVTAMGIIMTSTSVSA